MVTERTKMAGTQPHIQKPPPTSIYIIGAQSTGKTTLVTALGEYFAQDKDPRVDYKPPQQLKEVARGVLKSHNFTASDIRNSKIRALELQRLIIEAQTKAEEAILNEWYIADRSALDAVVYARQYVGAAEASSLQQGTLWHVIEDRMKAGVVILCAPGGQWLIDDGVRLMPEHEGEWFEIHSHFVDLLAECGIEYSMLPCSIMGLDERVQFVIDAWKRKTFYMQSDHNLAILASVGEAGMEVEN
ncbi:MAG: hypothetical protein Q9182_004872 [Xanthomendoza sp. 2 TL-2023]